jgi:hypothetical protein
MPIPNANVLIPPQTFVWPDLAIKSIRVSPWQGSPPRLPALGNLVEVTVTNVGKADAPGSTTSVILVTADSVKRLASLTTGKIPAGKDGLTPLTGLDLRQEGVLIVLADAPTKDHPLGQVMESYLPTILPPSAERNNVFAVPYRPSQQEQIFTNPSIQ